MKNINQFWCSQYFHFFIYLYHVSSYLLKLQDVFNLLPNLNVNELIKAFAGNTICHKCRHSNLGRYMGVICTYSFSFSFFFKSLFSLCAVKTNDMMLVIYLSSLIRSVIALHNLINNKVTCPLLTQIILSLSLSLSLSLFIEHTCINWADVCRLCFTDVKQRTWESWGCKACHSPSCQWKLILGFHDSSFTELHLLGQWEQTICCFWGFSIMRILCSP